MKRFAAILILLCCLWDTRAQEEAGLSLAQYKQRVADYSRDAQMAGQTLAMAVASARAARTAYLPSLAGSASYDYNFNPQSLELGGTDLTLEKQNWQAGGELSQNIYAGGRISGTYRSLKIEERIASLNQALADDNASYAAEVAYWNTAASAAQLDIARQYLTIVDSLCQLVRTRFDEGYIGKPDLLKAETSLHEAQYQLSQAGQLHTNDLTVLLVMMGAPVDSTVVLSQAIDAPVPAPPAATLDEALSRRPEYLISSGMLDLQQKQWDVERSDYLPKMSIGGTFYYGTPPLNFSGDLMPAPIVYARLSVPIFQWNKRKHVHDRNKALTISRELAQSQTADDIRRQLAVSFNDMQRSREQIGIACANLSTASESLELHTYSYRQGIVSLIDLQAAQIAWLQARNNLVAAHRNAKLSTAAYRKAAGEQ